VPSVLGLANTDDELDREKTADCVFSSSGGLEEAEFVQPLMLFLLFFAPFFNISSTP
jgi:hypothetical protein